MWMAVFESDPKGCIVVVQDRGGPVPDSQRWDGNWKLGAMQRAIIVVKAWDGNGNDEKWRKG